MSDFKIYRRHDNKVIPVRMPEWKTGDWKTGDRKTGDRQKTGDRKQVKKTGEENR